MSNDIHTGVISVHSIHEDVLDNIFNNGIDLDYEEFIKDNDSEDYEFDSPTILIGFIKDENGEYDIDPDAEMSLKYNGDGCTVQVLKSNYVKTDCYMCSPCYPNQGDLDTNSGSLTCYSLAPNMIRDEASDRTKTNIKEA